MFDLGVETNFPDSGRVSNQLLISIQGQQIRDMSGSEYIIA